MTTKGLLDNDLVHAPYAPLRFAAVYESVVAQDNAGDPGLHTVCGVLVKVTNANWRDKIVDGPVTCFKCACGEQSYWSLGA